MRLLAFVEVVPLIITLSGLARGQTPVPWLSGQAQPNAAGAGTVTESQLPLARARLETAGDVWVGQAVPLVIEVIVPSWFTSPPRFPELEVPNAVTLSPEAAWNFTLQSGRQSFPGQARRYLVFPQVDGSYAVPSSKVDVSYALPDGKAAPLASLVISSLGFRARVPPGAAGAKYFLTTDGFRVTQSFSRKPGELQAGDSFTRTVTMTAQNTVGIALPPLVFEAPDGLRLYVGSPTVAEKAARGQVEATRTEKATYLAEKKGRYTLPEIAILWWNPRTKAMRRATLPAIDLDVRPNTGYSPEVFAHSEAEENVPAEGGTPDWTSLRLAGRRALALFAALLLLFLARRRLGLSGVSLARWLSRQRKRHAEAEPAWFRAFRKASFSRNPKEAMRHLMFWLDRVAPWRYAPTLRQFAAESGSATLVAGARELEDILFARPTGAEAGAAAKWSGVQLYRLVARARRRRARSS